MGASGGVQARRTQRLKLNSAICASQRMGIVVRQVLDDHCGVRILQDACQVYDHYVRCCPLPASLA